MLIAIFPLKRAAVVTAAALHDGACEILLCYINAPFEARQ